MRKTFLPPGALVFDIGAHHGESADKFLNHYGAGRVISVEASRSNFAEVVAHWHTKLKDDRVVPIHAAVAEFGGMLLQIYRCPEQTGLSTVRPQQWAEVYPAHTFELEEHVPTVTLHQLTRTFGVPDFIKVDVEGFEFEVLHGLEARVPFLAFEFHGAQIGRTAQCLRWLALLGFTLARWVPEDIDLDNAPDRPIAEVLEELKANPPHWGNITVG